MMERCLVCKLLTFCDNVIADFLLAVNDAQDFNQPSQTFIAYFLLLSVNQCYLH